MPLQNDDIQIKLQAKIFEFALMDLVLQHREAFKPLWTVDSWVKFLIWMSLNCGLPGDRESLEQFAEALGGPLTIRMRQIFFERKLDKYSIRVLADPAEANALLVFTDRDGLLSNDLALKVMQEVGLLQRVVTNMDRWQLLNGVIAIPWQDAETT
tara:strand:- start:968 stop:1432 length:465 start_codon:yes stop_codon:yes gene_type:complete